jgi:O-antigen ligase
VKSVKIPERFWWPAIILIYPLTNIFYLIPALKSFDLNASRYVVIGIALIGGALFEWAAHPKLRLSDIQYLPRALPKNPVVLTSLALAVWVLIAAIVSKDPTIVLIGNPDRIEDSALFYIALMGLVILTYLFYKRNPEMVKYLLFSLFGLGVFLVIMATIEVILHRSIVFQDFETTQLPIATFLGRGHLAGFLALVLGAVSAAWFKGRSYAILFVFLFAFGIGICGNRAAIIASFVILLLGWKIPKRLFAVAVVVLCGYFAGERFIGYQNTGTVKSFISQGSISGRLKLWQVSLKSIEENPVFGVGGGLFYRTWFKHFTFEEFRLFLKDYEKWDLIKIFADENETDPAFYVKINSKDSLERIGAIKAHNQIIDISVMWGLVGLFFYGIIVISAIRRVFYIDYLGNSILAYSLFLMTWYVPIQTHGVFLILCAASAGAQKSGRSIST